MDLSAIERELEELETRVERLRALYEQYFMGLEKIEPQIPRKDVERRLTLLRREHIRNTAVRFKFQMLLQRYNTMQQYWARVAREIENGTYRRDVMRAAARFGEKEALTLVGKKRAKKYALLAATQEKQQRRPDTTDEIDVSVDDLIGNNGADALVQPPVRPESMADASAIQRNVAPPLPAGLSTATLSSDPANAVHVLNQGRSSSAASRVAELGVSTTGVKRRVAELAAAMKVQRGELHAATALDGLEFDFDEGPSRKPASMPSVTKAPEPAETVLLGSVDLHVAPTTPPVVSSTVARGFSSRQMRAPKPVDSTSSVQSVPPFQKASPLVSGHAIAAAKPAAPVESNLPDQRIRQIYTQYVEAKRAGNESTAGVTYEKLATSLRAQAEKLRASHPAKSVDYEVIVKDGKAHLKPILR